MPDAPRAADDFAGLIDAARRGESTAVEALLVRHLPDIGALVRLEAGPRLRTRESWSDLVQTVYREILTDLRQFRGRSEGEFKCWVSTLALRKLLEKRRFHGAARRDVAREARLFDCESTVSGAYAKLATAGPTTSTSTPCDQAAAREQVVRFEAAFDQLPEAYREVLLGAYFMDLPRAEMATRMGRNEEAVRQMLVRARARLATLLAATGRVNGHTRP